MNLFSSLHVVRHKHPALIPVILIFLVAAAGLAGYQLFKGLPAPETLQERLVTPSIRITDRNGRILYEALSSESGRHNVVPLDSIPLSLQQATIATEDSSFYSNLGVDLRGILRSIWINLRGGQTIAGGSTITQQVARNLLLSTSERNQRSVIRKLRELYLAWRITQRYSKDEILGFYLNQIYYGANAYGVEAAAQTYFGKPVSQLDLAESALLAGMPQAPALYNPYTDPDAAKARQEIVLTRMQAEGYISVEQKSQAGREPLEFAQTPYPIEAPHFVMMVRDEIDRLFTPDEIYEHGGLVVRTSLDLDWQRQAERAIYQQLQDLQRSNNGLGHNVNNAALVALDPNTGEILALVGSPDYFDVEHAGAINMAWSPRQPGSALKPILYATALDPGQTNPWTAATMLLDVRTSFLTHDGKAYTPADYDSKEHGPVLVRQALGSSLNIPAVLTLDHIGLKALIEQARRMGITTLGNPEDYDLSLALGGGGVRLIELTAAYGTFANQGYKVQPYSILSVSDFHGEQLYKYSPLAKQRVLDERVAWLISDILSDNEARILGFGQNSVLRLDRPAAVKTGTTSNFHDNWTVGYTPDLVVGVWTGNTSYEPMLEVNGLSGAAPIWHQFMRAVLTGWPVQDFQRPSGLVHLEVCTLSGLLPSSACPYKRQEWFIQGTQPKQIDTFYQQVLIDRRTGWVADENSPPEERITKTVLSLPPRAQPWARSQGLELLEDLVGLRNSIVASQPVGVSSPLIMVSPAPNSIFKLSLGFSNQAQRIPIQAVADPGLREVTLWVDGQQLEPTTETPLKAWWTISIGVHQAWAQGTRSNGEKISSEQVQFEVLKPEN